MADLALSESLINEYLKYVFDDNFARGKVRKLLKYIQPFFIKEDYFSDPSILGQLETDPLIEIIDNCSDEELVTKTTLKLMLVDQFYSRSFITLNIMDDFEKLKPKYGATYINQMGKDTAQKHIKALLYDANWVKISDSYINHNSSQWSENKNIIKYIVAHNQIDLTIESGSSRNRRATISQAEKNELKTICSDWNIKAQQFDDNSFHDRYIETDKLKILLSSGLYNLSTTSNKDFTYVIEIK